MRYFLTLVLFVSLSLFSHAQSLRDINYRFLYSPDEAFTFQIQPFRGAGGWTAAYKLQLRDSSTNIADFTIDWQIRDGLTDKEGRPLPADSIDQKTHKHSLTGSIAFAGSSVKKVLLARVVNTSLKQAWYFYKILRPEYPFNNALQDRGEIITNDYVRVNTTSTFVENSSPKILSYYASVFPAAVPPFSEAQGKVAKTLHPDSTIVVTPDSPITWAKKGLYLLQHDTTSKEGFSFRVEDDYPKLTKIESLADPLVYICTREEFIRVKIAKGDKKAFDKVILGITNNEPDRARNLFRSYFKRVELANEFFSSYKEGWKTDRGMVYIIFGLPEEIFRFEDREVWNYKNEEYKIEFTFALSSTLFDPENYVLLRDKKFQDTWYTVIDLWRNGRF
jgi:GWxTD domain-containing protein